MGFSLIPDQVVDGYDALDLEALEGRGVRVILADLDNTLARYSEKEPGPALRRWLQQVRSRGMELFVVSNGRRPDRSRRFCRALGVDFISHASKPHAKSFYAALKRCGAEQSQAVMIGDQIFTDIWGAHNAGIRAVLVRPVAQDTLFRRLRYGLETPFRALCRGKRP